MQLLDKLRKDLKVPLFGSIGDLDTEKMATDINELISSTVIEQTDSKSKIRAVMDIIFEYLDYDNDMLFVHGSQGNIFRQVGIFEQRIKRQDFENVMQPILNDVLSTLLFNDVEFTDKDKKRFLDVNSYIIRYDQGNRIDVLHMRNVRTKLLLLQNSMMDTRRYAVAKRINEILVLLSYCYNDKTERITMQNTCAIDFMIEINHMLSIVKIN